MPKPPRLKSPLKSIAEGLSKQFLKGQVESTLPAVVSPRPSPMLSTEGAPPSPSKRDFLKKASGVAARAALPTLPTAPLITQVLRKGLENAPEVVPPEPMIQEALRTSIGSIYQDMQDVMEGNPEGYALYELLDEADPRLSPEAVNWASEIKGMISLPLISERAGLPERVIEQYLQSKGSPLPTELFQSYEDLIRGNTADNLSDYGVDFDLMDFDEVFSGLEKVPVEDQQAEYIRRITDQAVGLSSSVLNLPEAGEAIPWGHRPWSDLLEVDPKTFQELIRDPDKRSDFLNELMNWEED